jgi:DNA-binding transcriptional ArsR family regulator
MPRQARPKPRFLRAAGYWWRDLRRPRDVVHAERLVLRALRRQPRWGAGHVALPGNLIERLTGLRRTSVNTALDVLTKRGLVRAYSHDGRIVYLPTGRMPSGVLTRNGSVRAG